MNAATTEKRVHARQNDRLKLAKQVNKLINYNADRDG
jgi:hypothetical protein